MTERGTLLGGRYELDQIIGRGGMAEVWRARDLRLVRDVAIKRLRIDLASDPTFQARFRREAQSAAGLNHPNIVAVYDTGEERDTKSDVMVPYIVMALVEGVPGCWTPCRTATGPGSSTVTSNRPTLCSPPPAP